MPEQKIDSGSNSSPAAWWQPAPPPSTAEFRELDSDSRRVYHRALAALRDAEVPFLLGGAYGFAHYTGIARHTKDLDIFVHRSDRDRVFEVLAAAGFRTELTFPHWLGKAFVGNNFIDIIFSSGNGIAEVDEGWFTHSVEGEVLGLPVRLCPPEEMIWSKAFIMERERYDGADIAHLLLAWGERLDWRRLVGRFGAHWRVLLSHLILFGFVYPAERSRIPDRAMQELLRRLQQELRDPIPGERLCQGTLLSREQYLVDLSCWNYQDARLTPGGNMTTRDVTHWTSAID